MKIGETLRAIDKKLWDNNNRKSETVATITGGLMIILPKLANMPMFSEDKRLSQFKDGLWVGKQVILSI